MKHLVIGVSPESSLELLGSFADIHYLDRDAELTDLPVYDTVYIRSHFAEPSMLPQKYRDEIDRIVQRAKERNPHVKFVDSMDTIDVILTFEDKWQQYNIFSQWMPRTELLNNGGDSNDFTRPIFKHRLSSTGQGVTWNREEVHSSVEDWIIQESLDITEELRVYVIGGEVYPIAAVRQSMTPETPTEVVGSRQLEPDEIEFSLQVAGQAPHLDIVGLDIARTSDGELHLIEVNRSPGFAKFHQLTEINLADELYRKLASS